MLKKRYWLERKNLRKGRDKKTHGKTGEGKKARTGDRRDERRAKPSGGRFTSFTPLIAPIDQVLMQVKDEKVLTYPGKLNGDPNR